MSVLRNRENCALHDSMYPHEAFAHNWSELIDILEQVNCCQTLSVLCHLWPPILEGIILVYLTNIQEPVELLTKLEILLDSSNSSDSLDQTNSVKDKGDGESQQSLVSVEIQTGVDGSGVPVAVISSNQEGTGFHFLSREFGKEKVSQEAVTGLMESYPKARSDLLEYLQKKDGTVVCKWCGQVLPSRTHWYRHKYKNHVPGIPSGIIKCVKCNTYFKSRKGYNGHCSARHRNGVGEEDYEEVVFEDDNAQDNSENIERASVRTTVRSRRPKQQRAMLARQEEYMKQRAEEEKLVADIIAKVKKECESQSVTMARRGYSRRHTVMSSGSDFEGKGE